MLSKEFMLVLIEVAKWMLFLVKLSLITAMVCSLLALLCYVLVALLGSGSNDLSYNRIVKASKKLGMRRAS